MTIFINFINTSYSNHYFLLLPYTRIQLEQQLRQQPPNNKRVVTEDTIEATKEFSNDAENPSARTTSMNDLDERPVKESKVNNVQSCFVVLF